MCFCAFTFRKCIKIDTGPILKAGMSWEVKIHWKACWGGQSLLTSLFGEETGPEGPYGLPALADGPPHMRRRVLFDQELFGIAPIAVRVGEVAHLVSRRTPFWKTKCRTLVQVQGLKWLVTSTSDSAKSKIKTMMLKKILICRPHLAAAASRKKTSMWRRDSRLQDGIIQGNWRWYWGRVVSSQRCRRWKTNKPE